MHMTDPSFNICPPLQCDSKFGSSCRNMLKSIHWHQRIKNCPTKRAIITKGYYCIDFDTWLMCTNLPPLDHYEPLSLNFLLSRWPIVNGSWGQLLLLPDPSHISHSHPHICWQADIGSWHVAETNLINFEPDLKSAQRIHQPEVTMRLQLLTLATMVIFATMVRSSKTVFPQNWWKSFLFTFVDRGPKCAKISKFHFCFLKDFRFGVLV